MKKILFILVLTIPLTAGIVFTSHRSSAQKLKAAQTKVLVAKRENISAEKNIKTAAPEAGNTEEWKTFRSGSELKIRNHEIRIDELKSKFKKEDEVSDLNYKKKIAYLEQQIKYVKVRLENYEKSPGNWESFKLGINNDMEGIENAFKNLTVESKK